FAIDGEFDLQRLACLEAISFEANVFPACRSRGYLDDIAAFGGLDQQAHANFSREIKRSDACITPPLSAACRRRAPARCGSPDRHRRSSVQRRDPVRLRPPASP